MTDINPDPEIPASAASQISAIGSTLPLPGTGAAPGTGAQSQQASLHPGSIDGVDEAPRTDDVEFVLLNDDVLTSVSNATMVLLDGSDLERMAVLYQFPQFLEHCPDETLNHMVPEIGCYAVSWKEEVQMAAAEALYFVVNMAVPEEVAKKITIAALRIIQESESGEVFDAWGEILSMMLPQVKRADVQALVVPATVNRAASHTVESRRLAARIIGSMNDTLTAEELEAKFLYQALRLCDDVDPSVRAMIAQSLAALGTKLPLYVSEKHLWPKLNSLMDDDNPRVRAAAMRAVARTAEAHSKHCSTSLTYRKVLLPVFLRECSTASAVAATDLRTVDDDTYLMLEIFSEVYGYFLCAVHPLFQNEETWTAALNSLRRMVTCNGPTVRHWCAFNIPAVAQVCGRTRPEKIRGVVQALSSDTDVETRATLAAGVHETTALLADGPLRDEMLAAIAMLMTDQNPQVRMNSLEHFAQILKLLSDTADAASSSQGLSSKGHGPSTASSGGAKSSSFGRKSGTAAGSFPVRDPAPGATDADQEAAATGSSIDNNNIRSRSKAASRQLAPIVSSLETMSHDSWRTQKLLAEQLEASAHLIPQEMLCEHVAPLLFQMARESTYLVRKASMSALVSVIRYIPDVRRRDHILKHFRSEWARGKVYWTRLAYIDASSVALNVLSNKLFTQLFASELFSLASDPVANVRLRLARVMPSVAMACGSKTAFGNAMKRLLEDTEDPDVVREARVASKSIAATPPRTAAQAADDARKEAAEKNFFIQRQKRKGTTSGTTGAATEINSIEKAGDVSLLSSARSPLPMHSVAGAGVGAAEGNTVPKHPSSSDAQHSAGPMLPNGYADGRRDVGQHIPPVQERRQNSGGISSSSNRKQKEPSALSRSSQSPVAPGTSAGQGTSSVPRPSSDPRIAASGSSGKRTSKNIDGREAQSTSIRSPASAQNQTSAAGAATAEDKSTPTRTEKKKGICSCFG